MTRLFRGLGSLAVLLIGTGGVPVALAFLGGNPLPMELSWSAMQQALLTPADGMILVGLITIVGWLAWLVFTLSVISELVAVVSQQRIRIRAPRPRCTAAVCSRTVDLRDHDDLGAVRRPSRSALRSPALQPHLAAPEPATLIIEPTETASTPRPWLHPGRSGPTTAPPASWCSQVMISGVWPSGTTETAETGARSQPRIPTVLTGGPDRLQVGWRLKIPDLDEGMARDGQRLVTVRRGDTLSSIAERELGAAARWTDIFHVNRAQLSDPDELAVGMRLVLPQPTKKTATKATASQS